MTNQKFTWEQQEAIKTFISNRETVLEMMITETVPNGTIAVGTVTHYLNAAEDFGYLFTDDQMMSMFDIACIADRKNASKINPNHFNR